jgi:hypothetical protein
MSQPQRQSMHGASVISFAFASHCTLLPRVQITPNGVSVSRRIRVPRFHGNPTRFFRVSDLGIGAIHCARAA